MITRKTIRATTLAIAAVAFTFGAACDREQPTSTTSSTPATPPAPVVTSAPLGAPESHAMPNGMPMQAHSGHPIGGGPMNGGPGTGMMNHDETKMMDGGMDGMVH